MARPNRPNDQSAKAQAPVKTPDTEQEEEEAQDHSEREQEQQRDHNRYGNAALSAMMGASVAGSAGAPEPGYSTRQQDEVLGDISYGGADDEEDAPLTIEELTRSWNPKARRDKDQDVHGLQALREDLPPEDTGFLEAIRHQPQPKSPDGLGDRLYQPTASSIATGLTPWAREVQLWTIPTPARRTLLTLVTPAAGFLQDPHGRAVLSRARAGAIATCMVLDGQQWSPARAAFTQYCLELAGSGTTVQEVWDAAEAGEQQLPLARDLAHAALTRSSHRIRTRQLSPDAHDRLVGTLRRLAALSPTGRFIPDLQLGEPVADPDDPLGLDDVLNTFTNAAAPRDQAVYNTAVRTAERLAVSCAHTRIRYAGVSAAIGRISASWSSGTPTADLLEINEALDHDVQRCLRLLVEVARAAKGRSVDLPGLRTGLKRASTMIERARRSMAYKLAPLIGGVILPSPNVGPEPSRPADALQDAWDDGSHTAALDALRQLAPGLERDIAIALTEAVLSNDADLDPLGQLSDATRPERPLLSAAVDVCLGGCAIWAENTDSALQSAARLQALGRQRRNGMVLTAGALTAMSALEIRGDRDGIDDLRVRAGAELHYLGAAAGVTLLARWTPPEP